MLEAVNLEAWDTTKYVQWTFFGRNNYLWDKEANIARISWGEVSVDLNLDSQTGIVQKKGVVLEGKEKDKLIQRAWKNWCNDSFWFNAPVKAFDPGTTRSIVKDKDGKEGLMVSYSTGGVTPGDQYLWFLSEDGKPSGYKMWVKILPVKGMYTSWDGWTQLNSGAWVATKHGSSAMSFEITNIKDGQSFTDFGFERDPFASLK